MVTITEIVAESYSLASPRIEHPEDLLLTDGYMGGVRALNTFEFAIRTPTSISFKPDGKPALIWGKDSQGFAMGDKYMFKKGTLPRSPDELSTILLSRSGGGREGLIQMYKIIWPYFEASLSSNFNGFVMGDLMYSSPPKIIDGSYQFKPNTVTYVVNEDSSLGKEISNSKAGIVAHSYFRSIGGNGSHLTSLNGLNTHGQLLIMSDSFIRSPTLARPVNLTSAEDLLKSKFEDINNFFDNTLDLGPILKRYVNFMVRKRSYTNFDNGLLPWIETTTISSFKKLSIKKWIDSHKKEWISVVQAFSAITDVKNQLISQLDKVPTDLHPFINGEPGHEGYIITNNLQPIKLVNRFRFSAANFAKDEE
jgi:hypothetical protein